MEALEANPNPNAMGQEFVRQYYKQLKEAPANLYRFYNKNSSYLHGEMTEPVQGQYQIQKTIEQLNFRACCVKISEIACQATPGNCLLVQVSGEFSNDTQPIRRFTESFVLSTQSPDKYFIHNSIFRYQDLVLKNDTDSFPKGDEERQQDTQRDLLTAEKAVKTKKYQCSDCKILFSSRQSLHRHRKNKICIFNSEKKEKQRKCPECPLFFSTVDSMCKHLEQAHLENSDYTIDEMTFPNMEAFQKWKENEDAANFVNEFNRCGTKSSLSGTKYKFYYCNFSHSKEKKRVENTTGKEIKRRKIGQAPAYNCPSRIYVKQTDKEVKVRYLSFHNHPKTFRNTRWHHHFPSTRAFVEKEAKEGVPASKIREKLYGDFGKEGERSEQRKATKECTITRKQIRVMQQNIQNKSRPKSAAQAVYLKAQSLAEKKMVVIYKPQNHETIIPGKEKSLDADKDLFLFGIQTKHQMRMMERGAQRVLCIDSTHQVTDQGFQLLNLIVPDDWHRGYPVAMFLVSRLDKNIMTCLAKALKNHLKNSSIEVNIAVIMTDDDKFTGPVFQFIFQNKDKIAAHLLCHWHVDQSWEKNLGSIKKKGLRLAVKGELTGMLQEKSKTKFHILLTDFISTYGTIEETEKFVRYFQAEYEPRVELWAACYRNYYRAETDTNMFCESYHKKQKYYYLEGKPQRRTDIVVEEMIKMEEEAYIGWRTKKDADSPTKTESNYKLYHARSMLIPAEHVNIVNETTAIVNSQTFPGRKFRVQRNMKLNCSGAECPEQCFSCTALCAHMFTCSCPVNIMCKHIHKVHSEFGKVEFLEDKIPIPDESILPNNDIRNQSNSPIQISPELPNSNSVKLPSELSVVKLPSELSVVKLPSELSVVKLPPNAKFDKQVPPFRRSKNARKESAKQRLAEKKKAIAAARVSGMQRANIHLEHDYCKRIPPTTKTKNVKKCKISKKKSLEIAKKLKVPSEYNSTLAFSESLSV